VRKLGGDRVRVRFCYEAGPCGYGIQRQLSALGHDCVVVAPSLIPKRAGDRIKTDRRDAASLARLHRVGELTAVWVPDAKHEAMRDLVRARLDAVHCPPPPRHPGHLLHEFLAQDTNGYPILCLCFYKRQLGALSLASN
jgi:hypothetical protein